MSTTMAWAVIVLLYGAIGAILFWLLTVMNHWGQVQTRDELPRGDILDRACVWVYRHRPKWLLP